MPPPGNRCYLLLCQAICFKTTKSILPEIQQSSRLRPVIPTVCVFPHFHAVCVSARKGIRFLCLMQADNFQSAQVCRPCDILRAIRRGGTHPHIVVVYIVIVRITVSVDSASRRRIIDISRPQPVCNLIPVYDEALRLTSPTFFDHCLSMPQAYSDSHTPFL